MKIYVAADHRGFEARQKIIDVLKKAGHDVQDESSPTLTPDDDYPVIAQRVVKDVLADEDNKARGILICASGQGVCMAANRFKGIRAALAADVGSIKAARNDDDANILCLPAEVVERGQYQDLLQAFLDTTFAAAPRFMRRIKEMDQF